MGLSHEEAKSHSLVACLAPSAGARERSTGHPFAGTCYLLDERELSPKRANQQLSALKARCRTTLDMPWRDQSSAL